MGNTMVLQPYYESSCIKIDFNPLKLGFLSRVVFFLGHPVYKTCSYFPQNRYQTLHLVIFLHYCCSPYQF